jgi:hypothetical protein
LEDSGIALPAVRTDPPGSGTVLSAAGLAPEFQEQLCQPEDQLHQIEEHLQSSMTAPDLQELSTCHKNSSFNFRTTPFAAETALPASGEAQSTVKGRFSEACKFFCCS